MAGPAALLETAAHNLRHAGFGAVREFAWRTILRHACHLPGDAVLTEDWDLLVVLDACRADLWAEVVGENHRLPVGATRIAPGGTTTEWLGTVFGDEVRQSLDSVGYVTGNPYSDRFVDGDRLGLLEEVWRYGWDDDAGTIPPREVTEAAIRAGRTADDAYDRLIVHYMQPHFPSLADETADGMTVDAWGEESMSVWEDLRFGRRSRESVWSAYRENLRLVLEDVVLLLSNIDADRVVITADHGNAMGERGIFGHAEGLALRALREVPWAVTEARDERTHEPGRIEDRTTEGTVEEHLRDLGYR